VTVPRITAVRTEGEGPALVLGPSLGTSTALWDPAVPALRNRFGLLAWDLPGHGESPVAREGFTMGELADAVVDAADEAGIEQFFYAGVSIGGAVALELALRHPERVKGVAVICSAAVLGTPEGWQARAASVRAQGTPMLVSASAARWFAPGTIARKPEITSRLLHTLSDADDESYALCCEALAGYDVRERLGEIDVPVISIAGAEDPVATPEDAALIASSVRNGQSLTLTDVAHLAPSEAPQQTAEALIRFFLKEI